MMQLLVASQRPQHRLFVDCDDTLVIWQDRYVNQDKELWVRDKWDINEPLVRAVHSFLAERPEYVLIVWSGGGVWYARRWAEKAFPGGNVMSLAKDNQLPREGDVLVDDMHI